MFLIIHNPLSKNKKSKNNTKRMVDFFKKIKIPFILKSTLKIDNLNVFLEKSPKITDILYLGGDGSINYLINNVDVSRIKQNIYFSKSGSGNDFFRSLRRIKDGNITIGEVKTNEKKYRFINGAGIGIDSLICHYVNNDKNKGQLSYLANFFKAIKNFKKTSFKVKVDGQAHEFDNAFFVAIQNGKYFGGGMKIAPNAEITSDEFDVYVVHSLSKLSIQLIFISVYFGWHKYLTKRVSHFRGKEIEISTPDNQFVQTDGEVIDGVRNLKIEMVTKHRILAFNKKYFKNYIAKKYHSN